MSIIASLRLGLVLALPLVLLASESACQSESDGSAATRAPTATASKFVGSWSYAPGSTIVFECPAGPGGGGPAGDGGGIPDGGVPLDASAFGNGSVVFTDAGTVVQTYALSGKSTWETTGDGALRETTDDGCIWNFTTAGDVATLVAGQSCDKVKDYSGAGAGPLSITLSTATTVEVSADGATLRETGKGELHGVCAIRTTGTLAH